jgi:putative membrane protein
MNRKPQAFVLDDAIKRQATHAKTRAPRASAHVTIDAEPNWPPPAVLPPTSIATSSPRRFRWGFILVSALFTLAGLWAGLAITQLVESFFARSQWLGWGVSAVAGIAAVAALAIILREIWGLYRLSRIEGLQARALNLDEAVAAKHVLAELKDLYRGRPDLAEPLRALESHTSDIMNPADRVRLADRLLLSGLDAEALRLIARRARRVTLLTAVTPAAALDILFVAAQNLIMLREVATLYGGRPSLLATWRLARMVVTHLAVAGGLALSDTLIQNLVGKGLLGRLSARFGEGAVNGILTSRIGLAAIDVCRPIPGSAPARDKLGNLLREVLSFGTKVDTHDPGQPQP